MPRDRVRALCLAALRRNIEAIFKRADFVNIHIQHTHTHAHTHAHTDTGSARAHASAVQSASRDNATNDRALVSTLAPLTVMRRNVDAIVGARMHAHFTSLGSPIICSYIIVYEFSAPKCNKKSVFKH